MSDSIFAVTASEFEEGVIKRSFATPILVDFWADWCQPCKQLLPILESLLNKHSGQMLLAKVNTDEEQQLAMALGIKSLPTVVLFKNGQMVEHFTGVQPESEIESMILPHLEVQPQTQSTDNEILIARQLIDSGQTQQAIEFLQGESSLAARVLLIKLLLSEGAFDLAQSVFGNFSKEELQENQVDSIATSMELLKTRESSESEDLKSSIQTILCEDTHSGIESLLSMLQNKDNNDTEKVKKALILAFELIEDPKTVSALRRKMASLIF